MALRMIIMGAPGAGKGTQAAKIVKKYNIPHISTGDILRDEIKQETKLGLAVREQIESGHLAPDELVCRIVNNRLEKSDCAKGYVLDGFPRTTCQAKYFDDMLQQRGESLSLLINIAVDDEVIVERLSARRICPICGDIYNLHLRPPKSGMRCNNPGCDGAELYQRADDHEAIIRERLNVYHEECEPVLDYYQKQSKLKNIAGEKSTPDDVFKKIEDIINANDVACT